MTRDETIRTHLAKLAPAAGVVDDPDALKVLETSEIHVAHDGSVVLPHRYWDGMRRAKPHLFKPAGFAHVHKDFSARRLGYSKQDRATYSDARKSYLASTGKR